MQCLDNYTIETRLEHNSRERRSKTEYYLEKESFPSLQQIVGARQQLNSKCSQLFECKPVTKARIGNSMQRQTFIAYNSSVHTTAMGRVSINRVARI